LGIQTIGKSYTAHQAGLAGKILVERDGIYDLVPLREVKPDETTRWGRFVGLVRHQSSHYWKFHKQKWNSQAEIYEDSFIFIATTALVHPRTVIHPEVWINDYAFIADGVELLAGARVEERQVISSGSRYHHLNADAHRVLRV